MRGEDKKIIKQVLEELVVERMKLFGEDETTARLTAAREMWQHHRALY